MAASERRYRLVTSRGLNIPAQKYVDIAPGGTLTMCRLEGAGRIVRIWLTLPIFTPPWMNPLQWLVLAGGLAVAVIGVAFLLMH